MTSTFEGQPPKTRPFSIKTRVIWVPGHWRIEYRLYFTILKLSLWERFSLFKNHLPNGGALSFACFQSPRPLYRSVVSFVIQLTMLVAVSLVGYLWTTSDRLGCGSIDYFKTSKKLYISLLPHREHTWLLMNPWTPIYIYSQLALGPGCPCKKSTNIGSKNKQQTNMYVSENNGVPPKSSILIGFSIIFTNHFGVPLRTRTFVHRFSRHGTALKVQNSVCIFRTVTWLCPTEDCNSCLCRCVESG